MISCPPVTDLLERRCHNLKCGLRFFKGLVSNVHIVCDPTCRVFDYIRVRVWCPHVTKLPKSVPILQASLAPWITLEAPVYFRGCRGIGKESCVEQTGFTTLLLLSFRLTAFQAGCGARILAQGVFTSTTSEEFRFLLDFLPRQLRALVVLVSAVLV